MAHLTGAIHVELAYTADDECYYGSCSQPPVGRDALHEAGCDQQHESRDVENDGQCFHNIKI